MNEKEALTRVKTGNFNGGYGFDMQLLVDAVGIIGEMFKSGQISEVVRCKDCKHYKFADNRAFGMPVKRCEVTGFEDVDDNDFCSRGERSEE